MSARAAAGLPGRRGTEGKYVAHVKTVFGALAWITPLLLEGSFTGDCGILLILSLDKTVG